MATYDQLAYRQSSSPVVHAVIHGLACLLPSRTGTSYWKDGPCERLEDGIRAWLVIATVGADVYVREN